MPQGGDGGSTGPPAYDPELMTYEPPEEHIPSLDQVLKQEQSVSREGTPAEGADEERKVRVGTHTCTQALCSYHNRYYMSHIQPCF
jgi:hypothetical protein